MDIPKIFSADVTKLIAADSYLAGEYGKPLTFSRRPMDPGAPESFEALCTILTNPSLIYFAKPKWFPEDPTPIMSEWDRVAKELSESGLVGPPKGQPANPAQHLDERCAEAIESFSQWIADDGTARRLVEFAQFQFNSAELMVIFWGTYGNQNNTEGELEAALYAVLKHHRGHASTIPVCIRVGNPFCG